MSNKKTIGTDLSEEDIVSLLLALRQEPHPEANFEDRFVHDFRERVARYAVTRPARKVLWEHILLRLTNIGKIKWACGATTLGVGVLAAGFFSLPTDDTAEQKRMTPTIGSARVVSHANHTDANIQPVIVNSSLALESSELLLPTWDVVTATMDGHYAGSTMGDTRLIYPSSQVYGNVSYCANKGGYVVYPGAAVPVETAPVKQKQITLPTTEQPAAIVPISL